MAVADFKVLLMVARNCFSTSEHFLGKNFQIIGKPLLNLRRVSGGSHQWGCTCPWLGDLQGSWRGTLGNGLDRQDNGERP